MIILSELDGVKDNDNIKACISPVSLSPQNPSELQHPVSHESPFPLVNLYVCQPQFGAALSGSGRTDASPAEIEIAATIRRIQYSFIFNSVGGFRGVVFRKSVIELL